MAEMEAVVGGERLSYWRSDRPGQRWDLPEPTCTVMLLHGLGSDHHGLLPLTPAWPDADIIAPDLPGFGHSPARAGPHAIRDYADTINALCARLDLPDVILIGHSLGANIALAHAAIYPERVRALALIGPVTTATGAYSWLIRAYYRLGALLPRPAARIWFLSKPAVYLADRSIRPTTDPQARRRILADDYRAAALADPHVIPEIYRSVRATAFAALAGAVSAPTLLIGAEHDGFAPPPALARLNRRLPRSELVVIPGAGHLWVAEEPEAAARTITAAFPVLGGVPG